MTINSNSIWTPTAVPADPALLPIYLARELLRASQVIKGLQARIATLEAKASTTSA